MFTNPEKGVLYIDKHKEISRLNVSGVDDLSVTWNVLKK